MTENDKPAVAPAAGPAEAPAEPPAGAPAEAPAAAPEAAAEAAPAEAATEPAAEPAPATAPAIAELSPAECGTRLAALFPALFGGPPKPIKLRIHADIHARAPNTFTKKSLSIFFHRHTTTTAYLKALVNSKERFDLDGQPAGELAEEHRAAAVVELDRRRAIVDAKRQAERDARRAADQAERQARQAQRPPRPDAPAEGQAGAPANPSPDARPHPRPPRHAERPPRRPPGHQADRPAEQRAERRPDRPIDRPAPRAQEPAAPPVHDADFEARRERAALLRAFETSTLTKANFCVLKRISEADLDVQLAQAREERALRPPEPPRFEPRRDDRPHRPDRPRPPPRGARPPSR